MMTFELRSLLGVCVRLGMLPSLGRLAHSLTAIDAGTDVMSTELPLYDYLTLAPRTDRSCILVCASGFPGVLSRCTFGSGLIWCIKFISLCRFLR